MKSTVAGNAQQIVLTLVIATMAAVPATAKEGSWKLDADHSTARIVLGTNAVNIGVAHVSGNVELNAAEPTNSGLDLSIDPAGGTLITFNSRRATMRPDGKLEVSGDLTVSRIVRPVTLNPGEDYSGPVYGEPTRQAFNRRVTFVLPMSDRGGQAEITAEANLFRENFPELFAAVSEVNWLPLVQDQTCAMPQASEDYAGAVCTGRVVGPDVSAGFASLGEDYHGFESATPRGNLMTIVLKLRLTRNYSEQATGGRNLR